MKIELTKEQLAALVKLVYLGNRMANDWRAEDVIEEYDEIESLVLDAAPDYVVPAEVSFVASEAQFTPKTVETASEREKLMFRVRARIPIELLQRRITQVKTGLPGMAHVKLDPGVPWPERLERNLVR